MSIYDHYRSVRTLNGQNRKARNESGDIKFLKETLIDSPNSTDIFIGTEKYRMLALSRREDIESFDLKFVAEREVPMTEGTILTYRNDKWIILHNQDTEYNVSKKGIGRKVTNEVKIFINGKQELIPICLMMTFNANDPIDRKIINAVIHDNNQKTGYVILQKNETTKNLTPYSRFLIGERVLEINFINFNFRGLVICSVNVVDYDSKRDNKVTQESTPLKENIIITNEESKIVSYTLTGPQQLLIGEEMEYLTNFDCTFTIDNPTLINIIEQTPRAIKFTALSKGYVTISALKDSEVKVSQKIKINGLI